MSKKFFWSAEILLCLLIFLCVFSHIIFPKWILEMPAISDAFDCDDAVETAYVKLQPLADRFDRVELIPMVGNLEKERETLKEINHMWLLVSLRIIGEKKLFFVIDLGEIRLPFRQYLEGYMVGHEEVLRQVQKDKDKTGEVATAGK